MIAFVNFIGSFLLNTFLNHYCFIGLGLSIVPFQPDFGVMAFPEKPFNWGKGRPCSVCTGDNVVDAGLKSIRTENNILRTIRVNEEAASRLNTLQRNHQHLTWTFSNAAPLQPSQHL